MTQQHDPETNKIISEAEALGAMFKSTGWEVAERELNDMVGALRDLSTVNTKSETIAVDIAVRQKTAEALEEWVNILKGLVNNVTILTGNQKRNHVVERR